MWKPHTPKNGERERPPLASVVVYLRGKYFSVPGKFGCFFFRIIVVDSIYWVEQRMVLCH
jgi:hypothetical protein